MSIVDRVRLLPAHIREGGLEMTALVFKRTQTGLFVDVPVVHMVFFAQWTLILKHDGYYTKNKHSTSGIPSSFC